VNKQQFFNFLRHEIRSLPKGEQEKAIFYYREIIDDSMEEGLTEEDAVARLGNPADLVREIFISSDERRKASIPTGRKVLISILLALGFPIWGSLLLVLLSLVLVAFILAWVPLIVLGSMALAFFLSGIWAIIGSPFMIAASAPAGIAQLGAGIAVLGLSILSVIALCYTFKGVKQACSALYRFVKKILGWRMVVT